MADPHSTMRPFITPKLSLLELCLNGESFDFMVKFFFHWPPNLILVLGRLSYYLQKLVNYYSSQTWNPAKLLRAWVRRPSNLLTRMRLSDAIICGPAVLHFFDRHRLTAYRTLDICVRPEGFEMLGRFITIYEGYRYMPVDGHYSDGVPDRSLCSSYSDDWFGFDIINRLLRKAASKQPSDPLIGRFRFEHWKGTLWPKFQIVLNVVWCDPIEFLFLSDSSKQFNVSHHI